MTKRAWNRRDWLRVAAAGGLSLASLFKLCLDGLTTVGIEISFVDFGLHSIG